MNNPTDAIPFDVVERFIRFWRIKAKESTKRTREAYMLMAFAAETILESYREMSKLTIKMPQGNTITFKKWKMFDDDLVNKLEKPLTEEDT